MQTGIELQVNSDPALDVALKVGAVSEQVNVEANAALVETRSSGVGEVIQNQRILELPLNGRNVTDLISMAGAAVQTGTTQTRWFSGLPVISIGGTVAAGGAGRIESPGDGIHPGRGPAPSNPVGQHHACSLSGRGSGVQS